MEQPQFTTVYKEIVAQLNEVDPAKYAKTRNFIDGSVSYLSPYISRGVITLPQVAAAILAKGYKPYQAEKFLQELAWREFFQRVWWQQGDAIFTDIKHPQTDVLHHNMIKAVADAATGIEAIDEKIKNLYQTGYMHNHVRMYTAGITCNIGKAHWLQPSQWMYYYLLDGDLASNNCSWQWVAGSFSSKKYIANQENVSRYLNSQQVDGFLAQPYETILDQPVPATLLPTYDLALQTTLPATDSDFNTEQARPLLIYTTYWLNPVWRKDEAANRVLLLEPSHFKKYPVSDSVMAFCMALAKKNIPGIKVFCGEFADLQKHYTGDTVISLQHPLHKHYSGTKDPYPWMFPQVQGAVSGFFSFWKKCEKFLTTLAK